MMLLTLLACASLCERSVDARVAAGEAVADRAVEVAQCEADLVKPAERTWIEQLAACQGGSCVHDVLARRAADGARRSGDWGPVAEACAEGGDQEPCVGILAEGVAALTAKVTAARDAGADPIEPCVDLMRLATTDAARGPANERCAEAEAARYAAEGAAQAAANLAAGSLELPLACGMALERLDALGTEWAKARAPEAARACYAELGKPILAAAVAGSAWGCSFDGRRVYSALATYDVHDPELDALMPRAAPLCRQP